MNSPAPLPDSLLTELLLFVVCTSGSVSLCNPLNLTPVSLLFTSSPPSGDRHLHHHHHHHHHDHHLFHLHPPQPPHHLRAPLNLTPVSLLSTSYSSQTSGDRISCLSFTRKQFGSRRAILDLANTTA